MKKIILFLVTAFTFSSCRDDDAINPSEYEGTYKLISFESSNPVDLNNDGNFTTNLIVESGCYDNSSLTLQNGNTAILRMQAIDVEYIPTDDTGENFDALVECSPAGQEVGTYNFTNNIINIEVNGSNVQFARTGNKLFCSFQDEGEFGDVYLMFERQ